MTIILPNHPGLSTCKDVNLNGKHVVLNADVLNKRYKSARFQLLKCLGGFGCNPGCMGKKISTLALDGEETTAWDRSDLIGIASPELVAECKADNAEPLPVDLKARSFFAINANKGTFAHKPTIKEALKEVSARTIGKGIVVYLCHPECQTDGLFFSMPPGTRKIEIKQFMTGEFVAVAAKPIEIHKDADAMATGEFVDFNSV